MTKGMNSLDVGCGTNPQGDVNIDVSIERTPYRKAEGYSSEIQPQKIKNFILADAEHLPLRSNTFNEVLCDSTLEHLKSPYRCLRESYRVCRSNGLITITTEHRLGGLFQIFRLRHKGAKTEHRFSRGFFLKTFGVRIEKVQTFYELLGVPCGLKVMIRKESKLAVLAEYFAVTENDKATWNFIR